VTADEVIEDCGDSIFAPESLDDVRARLASIEETGCPCLEGDHQNALHDLAHDDVPVLLRAIEQLSAKVERLAADESVIWAVNVLRKHGINGVMYDKLVSVEQMGHRHDPECESRSKVNHIDGKTYCASCGAVWSSDGFTDNFTSPPAVFRAKRKRPSWTLIATDDAPNMHRHDCDCNECRDEL
jgi:hypothetical protein